MKSLKNLAKILKKGRLNTCQMELLWEMTEDSM